LKPTLEEIGCTLLNILILTVLRNNTVEGWHIRAVNNNCMNMDRNMLSKGKGRNDKQFYIKNKNKNKYVTRKRKMRGSV
jgi:hypothetical protein